MEQLRRHVSVRHCRWLGPRPNRGADLPRRPRRAGVGVAMRGGGAARQRAVTGAGADGSACGTNSPGPTIVAAVAAARMTSVAPDPAAVDPFEVARAKLVEAL